jgi:two-component system LytT family sensor kinase
LLEIKDRWFRVTAILVPALILIYTSHILAEFTMIRFQRLLISLIVTVLVCEGSRFIVYGSYRWFPGRFRILLTVLTGVCWTALLLALSFTTRWYLQLGSWIDAAFINASITVNNRAIGFGLTGYALFNGLVNFGVLMLAYEILYRKAEFRDAEKQREKLEKDKLKAELNQLKGIVNPHFLFNNLNSLSALIGEDPDKAQQFLDELTQVFRYLLRNNQTELTTLEEELKFIRTYHQLLGTRYGSSIDLQINIDRSYDKLLIPPLTLQLLVENAVKHNRLQKENPLFIEMLHAPDKKLIVRNNLLPKEGVTESTGIGLQTINARYKILNRPGVDIRKTGDSFTAIISLIEHPQV